MQPQSYIHKTQNGTIEKCNEFIVHRVNRSRCFTTLADETADISTIEEMSLYVRYINHVTVRQVGNIFFSLYR